MAVISCIAQLQEGRHRLASERSHYELEQIFEGKALIQSLSSLLESDHFVFYFILSDQHKLLASLMQEKKEYLF